MKREDFSKKYYELLNGEYAGINLTRINDYEEFWLKQIQDSLVVHEQSKGFREELEKAKLMVDIGFGGGFPILPMANEFKEYNYVGIETRNKKVKVVTEIGEKLGLTNFKLFHSRIENVLIDIDCICTLKAVGKVYDFLSKISTDKIITVYFYKGPGFYELEEDQIKLALKDWDIVEETDLSVPGTEKRLLVGFRNKRVLRGTKNAKQLVKLSTIH